MGKVQIQAKSAAVKMRGERFVFLLKTMLTNLRSLIGKIQRSQVRNRVVWISLGERTGYTEQHRLILSVAAQELKVGHFDPQNKMEVAASESRLYFPRDKGHANAAGNDQIAKWVFEYLKSSQYLPSPSLNDSNERVYTMKRDSTLVLLVLNEIDGLKQVWRDLLNRSVYSNGSGRWWFDRW